MSRGSKRKRTTWPVPPGERDAVLAELRRAEPTLMALLNGFTITDVRISKPQGRTRVIVRASNRTLGEKRTVKFLVD